jgi:hypothetical protein
MDKDLRVIHRIQADDLEYSSFFYISDSTLLYSATRADQKYYTILNYRTNKIEKRFSFSPDYRLGCMSFDEKNNMIYAASFSPNTVDTTFSYIFISHSLYSDDSITYCKNKPDEKHPGSAMIGVCNDGRILYHNSHSSVLREYGDDGKLLFEYETIDDFIQMNDDDLKTPKAYNSSKGEVYAVFHNIKLISSRYAVSLRGINQYERKLDFWDIRKREYMGRFDIWGKTYIGILNNMVCVAEGFDSQYVYFGQYELKDENMDSSLYAADIMLTVPQNGIKSLLSMCEFTGETLMIINSNLFDCSATPYIYFNLMNNSKREAPYPYYRIINEKDEDRLISFLNKVLRDKSVYIPNLNENVEYDFPYSMLIDKKGKVIRTFNEAELREFVKNY